MNCLVSPDDGEVLVEGKEVRNWDPFRLRRRSGYVIQEVGLLPHLTVEENVALVPRLEGWELEKRRSRAHELLGSMRLPPEEFAAKRPSQLSGGQRPRSCSGTFRRFHVYLAKPLHFHKERREE